MLRKVFVLFFFAFDGKGTSDVFIMNRAQFHMMLGLCL